MVLPQKIEKMIKAKYADAYEYALVMEYIKQREKEKRSDD